MGKVFSPEQIASGHIPEPGAHQKAGRFILDGLFTDPNPHSMHDYVHSGMIYGSTAEDRVTRRSDVDVMVNYHGYHADRALPAVRAVFNEAESKFKIPIEHNIYQVGALADPFQHNFDPLFARYLVNASQNKEWTVNNPAEFLAYNLIDLNNAEALRRVALKFCAIKTRQFAGVLSLDRGRIDFTTLQRALELPVAISRKLQPLFFLDSAPDELTLDSAAYLRLMPPIYREDAGDKQDDLRELDQEYSETLEETISGERGLDSYKAWLSRNNLGALTLAHDVSIAWVDVLSHRVRSMDEYLELQNPVSPETVDGEY